MSENWKDGAPIAPEEEKPAEPVTGDGDEFAQGPEVGPEEGREEAEQAPAPGPEEPVYPQEAPYMEPLREVQTAPPEVVAAWQAAQAQQTASVQQAASAQQTASVQQTVPAWQEVPAWQGVPIQQAASVQQTAPVQQGGPVWQPPQSQPWAQGYPPQYGYYPQPVYPPQQAGYQAPGYPQPGQPFQPSYGQPQPPQQAPGYGYYAPKPPKKKMSTGLKVFLCVAAILAGLAIAGFGAYLVWNAVYEPDTFFSGGNDGQTPGFPGGNDPFPLPEGPGEDDTPKFDDGVIPPDDEEGNGGQPDVDVTPNTDGITIQKEPLGDPLSAQEVYEKVVKSTVTVAVSRQVSGQEQKSTGTGIIATSDGYIITNSHVVLNTKSSSVRIITYDGQEYDAVVVGLDRSSDLAVLKTNDHNFTPAEFGDSEELAIGDSVVAIGNPGGEKFSGSMTGGYISGLNREVGKYSENGMTYLQTDAAINPGNSGGPLVNMYGQVVGINSSKIITEGYEGMGFAIPISKAKDVIDQLLSGGYVKGRVRLGITGTDTKGIANYAFSGGPQGFMITEINEDSAFAGVDAREGDVIIALDGETVTCLDEISQLLLRYAPGDQVEITLYRPSTNVMGDSAEIKVTVTLLEDKGETQK